MIWKPNVTVAAVAVRNGKHLLVEEKEDGKLVLNQPAGHLDEGESLLDAVVRETLEETAWHFVPEFSSASTAGRIPQRESHTCVLRLPGMSPTTTPRARSTMAWCVPCGLRRRRSRAKPRATAARRYMRTLNDYLAGRRYPLDLLSEVL